ncbi:MAG: rhomboid family intramembrane serine protease [Phycisphaeraceae bacterium]
MGWEDRGYAREGGGGLPIGGAGGVARVGNLGIIYPRWGSVSLYLILINFGVLLIDGVVTRMAGGPALAGLGRLSYFFSFSLVTTFQQFRLYELLTFQFMHASLGHVLGNMLFMFFFGPMVESYFGSRRFLAFYLICGVGGAAGYLALWRIGLIEAGPAVPLVGASAGVFGMLIAALFAAPNVRVLLLFLIPVPLKVLVFIALFAAVYVVLVGGPNTGGEAAHLGGAAVGLLLMRAPRLLGWADRIGSPGQLKHRYDDSRRQRHRQRDRDQEAEVDRILDKVRDEGLQSLTRREQRILSQATERKRGVGR